MPLQATSGAASYDAFGGGVPVVPAYIEDVFSTYLYRGNGSTQTITNEIDLSGKGGMVWIKSRTGTTGHRLTDTARGVTKSLESNSTAAEATESTGLTAFNTTGFTVGADLDYNTNAQNLSSWTFRKQPKFFDVVTYTGDGASSKTIAHNLGSVPGCIIVKPVDLSGGWTTYHQSLGNTKGIYLNTTAAQATSTGFWNNTSPTSTQFTVGSTSNDSGYTFVAYIFAHDAGGFGLTGTDNVISCGSFTTDANGQISVTLGYEPQWLLWKTTAIAQNWVCVDNMRGFARTGYQGLRPNLTSGTEFSNAVADALFPTATGFATGNGSASAFTANETYIYIAIRRGPMKVPTSGTSVFAPVAYTGTNVPNRNLTGFGFPLDLSFIVDRDKSGFNYGSLVYDRLRGLPYLITSATDAEGTTNPDSTYGVSSLAAMDGVIFGSNSGAGGLNDSADFGGIVWGFRRAPTFFDEVCYTGTGSAQTLTHNLGATPELIITKNRTQGNVWYTYSQTIGATKYLRLNTTDAEATGTNVWNNTAPTSTQLTVGSSLSFSSGDGFVAYLFATCAGVSKVGSYTGTATTKQIDCGFTAGARFVLIKRTDSTGDWYVWDTARGIVSGNDPYLLLNSTAAETTTTDYIDTYSAGFELSSTAPAAINASGGTFIFLAIA